MTKEEKRACEFEALVCETNAIGAEMESFRAANQAREQQGLSQAYGEDHFFAVAESYRAMADKFRKLAQ